jgi:lysophospholipase L1-like esterase
VVKWHTHILEYFYVWALGLILFSASGEKLNKELKTKLFTAFSAVVLSLGIVEICLQISGTTKTYLEKVSGFYDSPYTPQDKTYYHTWTPNIPHLLTKPEYSFERPTNSLGFGDKEWDKEKKTNEKRILSIGDSFTEGDGAHFDSSYVSLLRSKLALPQDSFSIMNAGVCGSDLFNNYIILKDKLISYKPDIIIQTLATNDITTDILIRGGMERFQKNGTLKYTSAPWWEPLYAISYISRLFFNAAGYNELLLKGEIKPEVAESINNKVIDLLRQYSKLCNSNHTQFIIVLRPDRNEIETNKYYYDFEKITHYINSNKSITYIDLLPSYKQYIASEKSKPADYFWCYDGHHNAKGYEMMAQIIADSIIPILKH